MLIQSKQIFKLLTAMVGIAGFTTSAANSDNLTSALTTALGTAGNGGVGVPVQAGTTLVEGVSVGAGANNCNVFIAGTKNRATDANGNDVYGVLTLSSGVYTLAYFANVAGTATAYTWGAATSIDLEVPYVFSLTDLPQAALVNVTERHVAPDPALIGGRTRTDVLVPTATNTLPNLSTTPAGGLMEFSINGQAFTASVANGITVAGQVITVTPANLGYNIATTDNVTAFYSF